MTDTPECGNDTATCEPIDTGLTQACSPSVRGFTYFVRSGDLIKIGHASNFPRRLRTLQSSNGGRLVVLAAVPEDIIGEYNAHRMFAHLRVHGEWFRAEPELLQFIERTKMSPRKSAPAEDPLISKLHKLRLAHGAESPIGHRCSNLAQMIPAYRAAKDDPDRRAFLAAGIQRQMTDLASQSSGL